MLTDNTDMLVLILSKKQLKANHNTFWAGIPSLPVGFNIVKETIESKSQLTTILTDIILSWF